VGEARAAARRIEELGYGSLWAGEILGGRDTFAFSAIVLAATTTVMVGTGIANLWARHPATMQAGATTLAEAWPGRLVLGVGVSHAPVVEAGGHEYVRPLDRMVDYLDGMDREAAASPPPVAFPRVLAALGPRMLELARDRADGAHPYFVPPAHTEVARRHLGPDRLLLPEQAVVLQADPVTARRVARRHMAGYLTLPNYVNNLLRLGYTEEDVAGGGSDRLVDAVVAWGDEAAIAARVAELRDAGADHVLLQPLGGGITGTVAQLEALAPAVLGR
jgi:probable F420-dependent oxidoreductase